jgi:lipopolysaccharide/colanic/teichoic acid biosynthesis glycosyltransferase
LLTEPQAEPVSIPPGKFTSARRTLWHRIRFQLGLGLLLAAIIPYAVQYKFERPEDIQILNMSVMGTLAALIGGYYAFRRVSHYPGVRASYHILPSFAVSYGLVLAVFFFARLDYSRFHFLLSFLLCVFWYYIVYFKLQRQQRLRIGVVPYGEVEHLFAIPDVSWSRLDDISGEAGGCDAIVADLRFDIPDEWERFLADRALAGTLIMHVKQMEESLTGRVSIEHLSENNLGSLIPGIVYAKIKRLWDLGLSVAVLPLALPFLLFVGILIRLDSKGPALFRQERMGYGGNPFTMYKFRSMHSGFGADDARVAAMTREEDDRVTRVGRFIRRYRIDELPQIINVLKGEMSWIGPRPEAVALSDWYEAELPFYRYRHIVRPGITGWAQVKQGHVADVEDVLWKLQYDFYYIKNFSFWLDLLIIARTMRTVLSGFGAR